MLMTLTANYLHNQYNKSKLSPQNGPQNGKKPPKPTPVEFWTVIAIFILEVAFMVYAIYLAVSCGQRHDQLFLNILAAIFFPVIYVIYALISGCYKS